MTVKRGTRLKTFIIVCALLLTSGLGLSRAADITFLRIGTGPTSGTYFPIGGLISNAISNPPGSRPCEKGGSCGVPGIIAVAQSTHGSVDNVKAIGQRDIDAAIVQADVAYWAFHGSGIFAGQGAIDNLRAVAMLFPSNIHIVARKDSGIKRVQDLHGKRVSLGEKESGTFVDAKLILTAYGVARSKMQVLNLAPGAAADLLAEGKLDAFFLIDGAPTAAISELASRVDITLIPIEGKPAQALMKQYPFLMDGKIPDNVYKGVDGVKTLNLGATLVVQEALSDELVYGIAKALWHNSTKRLFANGHPKAKLIKLEYAVKGLGVALHRGAAAYYEDIKARD